MYDQSINTIKFDLVFPPNGSWNSTIGGTLTNGKLNADLVLEREEERKFMNFEKAGGGTVAMGEHYP